MPYLLELFIYLPLKKFDERSGRIKTEISQVKIEVNEVKNKVNSIEKIVNSHTDLLNSFKFDVDYIAQRQTKTDMKVNRIENRINS